MEQKTPLYSRHVAAGGKMVPFAGYLLPVQYPSGVIAEHMAVRTRAGLFDVSHMGEVLVCGAGAPAYLNRVLTNDFTSLRDGCVRYSPMCDAGGGCVDDLIVYRFAADCYMVVVNAANRAKDVAWLRAHVCEGVQTEDISDTVAQLALQGPRAREILAALDADAALPEGYYRFCRARLAGLDCLISQTGYTGEDGFEVYLANEDAPRLWDLLLEVGAPLGLLPCGLGARDTLRLEAGMPLYGHEIGPAINPLEAGLGFAVKLQKEAFLGREALAAHSPPLRKRVGLRVTGRGIVREQQEVFRDGVRIGHTTSGTHGPFLQQAIAMALVEEATPADAVVEVEVRGRRVPAQVVPLPFYKRDSR